MMRSKHLFMALDASSFNEFPLSTHVNPLHQQNLTYKTTSTRLETAPLLNRNARINSTERKMASPGLKSNARNPQHFSQHPHGTSLMNTAKTLLHPPAQPKPYCTCWQ
ncbi:hypothetical protein KC19_7G148500 [Ceratodon purpureus]|uniref:Uncharacterized protein n=1 Tax=Ceratodon purpureus TaxID=3225 RepID=A0A8T0H6N0_CERPU|nr:hypothetical protein KC19_7G148500 [Ceratodon purpureus]